jgi:DNA-binding transcriptional LysR family regulator
MPHSTNLNLLPLFVAVVEARSISEAARRLRLPKSSVSRGVAALENSLGVQLFHRTTHEVATTSAGRAFYEKAVHLVESLKELTGSLPEQEDQPAGELRISVAVDMGLTWFTELAAGFSARHPSIHLDVRVGNRLVDLVAEGYDVGLRVAKRMSDSSLVARKLTDIEMGLFASPAYVAQRGRLRVAAEAGNHDWVLFVNQRIPAPVTRSKHPRVITDDLMFAREAIKLGVGIGVLPVFLTFQDVTAGRLVRLIPRWSYEPFTLFFVHPAKQHVPKKVSAFREYLLAYLAGHPFTVQR